MHVYWSVTPEQSSSPYVRTVVAGLRDRGVTVSPIGLLPCLRTSGSIVHIQWPEHVSRGASPTKTALKQARAFGLLAIARARGHAIVLTAHNRVPHHETNAVDSHFRNRVYANADALVALVGEHFDLLMLDGTIDAQTRREVIPHPLVSPVLAKEHTPSDGPLVILGQIHSYHLVEEFVAAWERSNLRREAIIIGAAGDKELVSRLEGRALNHDRLSVHVGFMPDDELGDVLTRAAAIIALQRNPFNSGAPFDALPRGLPIVLSAGAQADDLTRTVGAEWVFTMPAEPHADDIASLEAWLGIDRTEPSLHPYQPDVVCEAHIELYRSLLR